MTLSIKHIVIITNMLKTINQSWGWKGFTATEIIASNDFGNIIFKTEEDEYWRICPEEVSCVKIALDEVNFKQNFNHQEFKVDWEMTNLIEAAQATLGKLNEDEKYCLKKPAVFGGKYRIENFGKMNFIKLISSSGTIGKQIDGLSNGDEIELKIIE